MSVRLICQPEFFHRRLNSQLNLNVVVEPGTTYFLCSGLEELSALVSAQNLASITPMSEENKVQVLICKEKSDDTKSCLSPKPNVKDQTKTSKSALSAPEESSYSQVPVLVGNEKPNETKSFSQLVVKAETDLAATLKGKSSFSQTSTPATGDNNGDMDGVILPATVTLISGQNIGNDGERNIPSVDKVMVEAPVVKAPLYPMNNVNTTSSAVLKDTESCSQVAFSGNNPVQQVSVGSSVGGDSNLPCQALRQELKQAILQRRMIQGKTMIDLTKEDYKRQMAIQNIKMSDEEIEKMIKRRVANNMAARKCRAKRKLEEKGLTQELKKLCERKNELNEIIWTLENQKSFLRMWVTGSEADSPASKEMLRTILNSEVKIPSCPPRTVITWEEDITNSANLSNSEYNSDDTRNGFDFDSSQETNDNKDAEITCTEMTKEEINRLVSDELSGAKVDFVEGDKKAFGKIRSGSEDVLSISDEDSDLELIEMERPLVIDVN